MTRGSGRRPYDAPIVLQPAEYIPMTPAEEREVWALIGRLLAPRLAVLRSRPAPVAPRALTRGGTSSDGAPPSAPLHP